MLSTLSTGADAYIGDLDDLLSEFIDILNAKEVARRAEVNSHHFGQYGRLLYPEGGQYATYSTDKPGRKFIRVVQTIAGSQHVHCFIDRATGDVLKAAGWAAPAKGARYSLLDADSRNTCFERCEFTGGYLYVQARR